MRERFHIVLMTFLAFNFLFVFWKMWPSGPAAATFSSTSYVNSSKFNTHVQMNESGKFVAATDADDSHRLINLNDFGYILQQSSCSSRVRGLILVHSAALNFEKRQVIRQTWANGQQLQSSALRVIFLLGAVKDTKLQAQLISENAAHGDLVQGSFLDSYRNMTYKHVMALKWFFYSCPNASALIKVDDDVFVNTPQLLKYAQTADSKNGDFFAALTFSIFGVRARNLLFCDPNKDLTVKRTYRSKWRVSFREYAAWRYPQCCLGYAIVYSNEIVRRLYVAAQAQPYFWIDDVHITGTVRKLQRVQIKFLAKKYFLHLKVFEQLLQHGENLSKIEFLFSYVDIRPKNFPSLWQLFPQSQFEDLVASKSEVSADRGIIDDGVASDSNATTATRTFQVLL